MKRQERGQLGGLVVGGTVAERRAIAARQTGSDRALDDDSWMDRPGSLSDTLARDVAQARAGTLRFSDHGGRGFPARSAAYPGPVSRLQPASTTLTPQWQGQQGRSVPVRHRGALAAAAVASARRLHRGQVPGSALLRDPGAAPASVAAKVAAPEQPARTLRLLGADSHVDGSDEVLLAAYKRAALQAGTSRVAVTEAQRLLAEQQQAWALERARLLQRLKVATTIASEATKRWKATCGEAEALVGRLATLKPLNASTSTIDEYKERVDAMTTALAARERELQRARDAKLRHELDMSVLSTQVSTLRAELAAANEREQSLQARVRHMRQSLRQSLTSAVAWTISRGSVLHARGLAARQATPKFVPGWRQMACFLVDDVTRTALARCSSASRTRQQLRSLRATLAARETGAGGTLAWIQGGTSGTSNGALTWTDVAPTAPEDGVGRASAVSGSGGGDHDVGAGAGASVTASPSAPGGETARTVTGAGTGAGAGAGAGPGAVGSVPAMGAAGSSSPASARDTGAPVQPGAATGAEAGAVAANTCPMELDGSASVSQGQSFADTKRVGLLAVDGSPQHNKADEPSATPQATRSAALEQAVVTHHGARAPGESGPSVSAGGVPAGSRTDDGVASHVVSSLTTAVTQVDTVTSTLASSVDAMAQQLGLSSTSVPDLCKQLELLTAIAAKQAELARMPASNPQPASARMPSRAERSWNMSKVHHATAPAPGPKAAVLKLPSGDVATSLVDSPRRPSTLPWSAVAHLSQPQRGSVPRGPAKPAPTAVGRLGQAMRKVAPRTAPAGKRPPVKRPPAGVKRPPAARPPVASAQRALVRPKTGAARPVGGLPPPPIDASGVAGAGSRKSKEKKSKKKKRDSRIPPPPRAHGSGQGLAGDAGGMPPPPPLGSDHHGKKSKKHKKKKKHKHAAAALPAPPPP